MKFAYSRLSRWVTLQIGVELERLLGTQDYFSEELYALIRIQIRLPARTRGSLQFRDGIRFSAQDGNGQESRLSSKPINRGAKGSDWFRNDVPMIVIEGLEFAANLRDMDSIDVSYATRHGFPVIIFGGRRRINRTENSISKFRWHGASVVEFLAEKQ